MANTCEEYSSQITVDRNWMVARALGILALVISGVHAFNIMAITWKKETMLKHIFVCEDITMDPSSMLSTPGTDIDRPSK